MKKFEGILICTDLDGTLLRKDKSISEENLRAVEYFMSEGGLFTFVTGRMPFSAKRVYSVLHPNAPIGCINGGALFDTEKEKYIWTNELSHDAIKLVRYIDENVEGIGIQTNSFEHVYFARENLAMKQFREATGDPNLVKNYDDFDEPLAKIIFGDTREDVLLHVRDLLLSHPEAYRYDFIRSEKRLFEILPKGSNKGVSITKLCELYGIDHSRTIAVGDYDNDIEMIKAAHIGIAVANATEGVKAACDLVTVSNEEDAIAKIIYDIESGTIKI